MHEASIAVGLLDLITRRCISEGYKSIDSVRIKIGRASGILPEALVFSFDAAKIETIADKARLFIDIISLGGFCGGCGKEFEVEGAYVLRCPLCGSGSFKINRGYEMEIVEMEAN